MRLYLSIIGIAMFVISAFNIALNSASWQYVIISVILCTAAQFALDGLLAIIINKLPDRYFDADNPFYEVSETEKQLYKKLRVRSWKDKIWELGGLGGFSKKNLINPKSPEYINKFIVECNKGVITHRLSYPIGFLPLLFFPKTYAFSIALPIALVNLVLNVLPTLALRYNTPKLRALLTRMNRKTDRGGIFVQTDFQDEQECVSRIDQNAR